MNKYDQNCSKYLGKNEKYYEKNIYKNLKIG